MSSGAYKLKKAAQTEGMKGKDQMTERTDEETERDMKQYETKIVKR